MMYNASFCALGQSLIMPIKSTLANYNDDFSKKINKMEE
jgi:NADH:ubiquinone oxidoreductase subunit F (NADH-binding)